MSFLGRWLSHSLSIIFAIGFGLVVLQAPALTQDYLSVLLQVSRDARQDIDQRMEAARRIYGIAAATDAEVVAALQPREPANAETLALSLKRAETLRRAYERIVAQPALLQPLTAVLDLASDTDGYKRRIAATLAETYTIRLDITFASAAYGAAGVLLGVLLAQLLVTVGRRLSRAAAARATP